MKRKIFGTDGIRGKANVFPMTPEIALQVGKALVYTINHKKKKTILIGKDTRISGYIFETALTSGICSAGADVLLTGPLPTAAVAHLTKSMGADAGIMISASHNNAEDNGIKFFSFDGYKFNSALESKIEENMRKELEGVSSEKIGKTYRVKAADSRYIEYAKQVVDNISLKGIKIVLDCSNGASYKIGPQVFNELGAEVIALNDQPNGFNINEECGVFFPEKIIKKVISEKADIGIILDGDADRLILIDEKGKVVNGIGVLSIMAPYMKKNLTLANNLVVTTVMANGAFHSLMKENSIDVLVTPVGDKYVIDEMRKTGAVLGGESSGHLMLSEFSTSADGIVVALKVLEIMSETKKSLAELLSGYKEFPQILINKKVASKPSIESLKNTSKAIKDGEKEIGQGGRILVRYSGTENIARIMVEGKNRAKVELIAESIAKILESEVKNAKN